MVTDKTRRSAFIEQNLGLVHSCAGRFRGRGIEYDDLYSAMPCRSFWGKSKSCSGMAAP